MAKANGPLLSLAAHGKIGNVKIFQRTRIAQSVKKYAYPNKQASPTQLTQRGIIASLTAHWQVMSAGQKGVWIDIGGTYDPPITGFNAWIKVAQTDLLTYHGLLGYWSMNEPSGAMVADASGNGNDGTLEPSYPNNSPQRTNGPSSKFGNALIGDGIDDNVNCGALAFGTTDYTFAFWMKFIALSGNKTIAQYENMEENESRGIRITPSGIIDIFDGNTSQMSSNTIFEINKYYHILITMNTVTTPTESTFILYVNGVEDNTTSTQSAPSPSTTRLSFFERANKTQQFAGCLDDIRIYNRILSAGEALKQSKMLTSKKRRQPTLRGQF